MIAIAILFIAACIKLDLVPSGMSGWAGMMGRALRPSTVEKDRAHCPGND